MKHHKMTPEEAQFIRRKAQLMTDAQIAQSLGITTTQVAYYRKSKGWIKKPRRHPIGTIKLWNSRGIPYKRIKLKNGWKPLHIHRYELVYGPVPKGKVVKFRDGNQLNTSLDNLTLATKKEVFLSNHNHKKSGESLRRAWQKQKRRLAMGLSPVNKLGLKWRNRRHVKGINTEPVKFNHFDS